MEPRVIFLCALVHLHNHVILLFGARHSHFIGDKFEKLLVFVGIYCSLLFEIKSKSHLELIVQTQVVGIILVLFKMKYRD